MADGQNRSYPATPRKLLKAREKGDVPLSREVAGLLAYCFVCGTLGFLGIYLLKYALKTLAAIVSGLYSRELAEVSGTKIAMTLAVEMSTPVLVASVLGTTMAILVQTRFLLRTQSLGFDLSRLNPTKGFKRLFGLDGSIELAKSVLKITMMTVCAWLVLARETSDLSLLPLANLRAILNIISILSIKLLICAGFVQLLMAVLDVVIVRLRFFNRHKMTKEDLKEEFKETEGNPFTKSRIRRQQRIKRRQLKAAVQTATVVVTNPTHFAVALAYDRAVSAAPRIVAKGADLVALRIRELAKAAQIPVIENPSLARALFRLDWDTEIPPEHYKAVAEIVAFVWRIRGVRKRL